MLPDPGRAGASLQFNDASGATTVKDSAGTADGTLQGGATLDGAGKVTLDGTSGYVDLPNGTISALTNATFEAWVTFNSGGGAWQRVFDFGDNSNGEDQQGTGTTYIFLTPTVGTSGLIRFAGTTNSNGAENPSLNGPLMPTDQEAFLAVTYDYTDNRARLYLDGQLIASGLAPFPLTSLQDVNNWLGRSNWPDAYFNGSFNEFRIYDAELSPLQIALDAQAGPDQLGSGSPGPVQSITLAVDSSIIKGDTAQASVAANFNTLTNIDVSADAGVTYTSSATNILTVSASGLVKA